MEGRGANPSSTAEAKSQEDDLSSTCETPGQQDQGAGPDIPVMDEGQEGAGVRWYPGALEL